MPLLTVVQWPTENTSFVVKGLYTEIIFDMIKRYNMTYEKKNSHFGKNLFQKCGILLNHLIIANMCNYYNRRYEFVAVDLEKWLNNSFASLMDQLLNDVG